MATQKHLRVRGKLEDYHCKEMISRVRPHPITSSFSRVSRDIPVLATGQIPASPLGGSDMALVTQNRPWDPHPCTHLHADPEHIFPSAKIEFYGTLMGNIQNHITKDTLMESVNTCPRDTSGLSASAPAKSPLVKRRDHVPLQGQPSSLSCTNQEGLLRSMLTYNPMSTCSSASLSATFRLYWILKPGGRREGGVRRGGQREAGQAGVC